MRVATLMCAVALVSAADPAIAAATKIKAPYFASISAAKARMRTGPGRSYPASWLYQRADLPVRVIASFKEWRKVEDPDGTQGWMQANLVSSVRTAIVRGTQPVPLLEQPSATGKLLWKAAPGVVGRISECADGWCKFDVKGRGGWTETGGIWGADRMETAEAP